MTRVAVCLPTYNEAENVALMLDAVLGVFDENGIDGRILVITPGDPSVTRVLTDETREGRDSPAGLTGEDPRLASFAVTAADILSTST